MLYCGEEIGTGVDPKVGLLFSHASEFMSDAVEVLRARILPHALYMGCRIVRCHFCMCACTR